MALQRSLNKFNGEVMSKRERSFCLFLLDSSTHHKKACEENEFEVGREDAKTEKKEEARKAEECSQTGSSRGVGGDAAGCCASL